MTVRTLSGATVTLVGRGANYFDGYAIIPSFVDADGTQYFIVNDPDDLTAVPAIVNGLLTVKAAAIPPITIAAANAILVNDPMTVENSTSALVFAKRCGIEVSGEGLVLWNNQNVFRELSSLTSSCEDGVFILEDNTFLIAAYVGDGWGGGKEGYVGCNFEPADDTPGDINFNTHDPGAQQSSNLLHRMYAHNSWIFILAGVPESVFAVD